MDKRIYTTRNMGAEMSLPEGAKPTAQETGVRLSIDDTDILHVYIEQMHFARSLREVVVPTNLALVSRETLIPILRAIINERDSDSIVVQEIDTSSRATIRFKICAQIKGSAQIIAESLDVDCARIGGSIELPGQPDIMAIIGEKASQFTAHLARIWSEGHAYARDIAMQKHFADAERHFGRITPAQETFARRLFSAEIDGSPIVFEAARSFGVCDFGDKSRPDYIPMLPLYARSIVRFVNGHYTCLRSLEYVHCHKLIFVGNAICKCHNCASEDDDKSMIIKRCHERWYSHETVGSRLSRCELLRTNAREIIMAMIQPLRSRMAQRIAIASNFDITVHAIETNPLCGIVLTIIRTARENPEVFARANIIIDSRTNVLAIAEAEGIGLPAIAHAKYEDLSGRNLMEYNLTAEYLALRASMRENAAHWDIPALLRECGEMTFAQWYGL